MTFHPKVVFVTRKWAPAVGGMETWSMRISEALQGRADVEVVSLPGQPDGRPPGPAKLMGFPFVVIKRTLARRWKADVVHIGDLASWPLALLCGRSGGIVISAHGTDASYPRRGGILGSLYGAYLKLGTIILGRAIVVANSNATADAVREAGWRRVEVIPLATTMTGRTPEQAPSRHLLFAGRIIPLKGLSWFVSNVLPLLDPGMDLHVAGLPMDRQEAAALDHPRVKHLGVLSQEQLADAYRGALCVVVPNIVPEDGTFEGFGLVATEAAAAGGVVLASRSGGLPSAIVDEMTGFLLPPGDAVKWKDAISTISQWPLTHRQKFVSKSLTAVDDHFRWGVVADQTMVLYRRAHPSTAMLGKK